MANSVLQASLPALPIHRQSDVELTAHIASRFHAHQPISYLSTGAIVAVNTNNSSSRGRNGDREGSAMEAAEALAARSYARLGHRSEDQAIVFLGESGSGKTTFRSHLLSSLLSVFDSPLARKLTFATFVFDALTTTKTATATTASKAGLFLELQYGASSSARPMLVGGKLLQHRLERSRVSGVPPGERNFHLLYYLLAGTSPSEKDHLGLVSQDAHAGSGGARRRWRYLGHPSQLQVGMDDVKGFHHFKTALRKLEFPRDEIAHICEILAGILHIGQLEFHTTQTSTRGGDDGGGGYGHDGSESVTTVKNREVLTIVAAFLGVPSRLLEQSMGCRTRTLHNERVTIMLDPNGARENADELSRTLYALTVALIVEKINQRISTAESDIQNTISIVDFPGFALERATSNTLDQLLNNAATESLYHFCLDSYFERKANLLDSEEVQVPATSYFDNGDAVRGLLKSGNGLLSILDDQTRRGKRDMQLLQVLRRRFEGKNPAIQVHAAMAMMPGNNFASKNTAAGFTVKHFAGEVDYPIEGLIEANGEVISGDLMNLVANTTNPFVAELFGQEALQKVTHPHDRNAVTQASVTAMPQRMPSVVNRKASRRQPKGPPQNAAFDDDNGELEEPQRANRSQKTGQDHQKGTAAQFLASLDVMIQSISSPDTNPYFVFCLKPNDRRISNQFDSTCVRTQIQTLGIAEISQRLKNADFSVFMPFGEFLSAAEGEVSIVESDRERAEMVLNERSWPENEARVGTTGVFLSERCWRQVTAGIDETSELPVVHQAGNARSNFPGDQKRGLGNARVTAVDSPYESDDQGVGYFNAQNFDARSEAGASAFRDGDMFRNLETRSQMAQKGNAAKVVEVEQLPLSGERRRWLAFVWCLTFYMPDFAIRIFGKMPRKDVRVAWREKLAINLLIWFSCLVVLFFMIGVPRLICPPQNVYSLPELSSFDGQNGHSAYVAIRGFVFDLGAFAPEHDPKIVPTQSVLKYAGLDATNLFPIQVSAMCQGVSTAGISPAVQLTYNSNNYSGLAAPGSPNDPNAQYHDFRWATNLTRPTWFTQQMLSLRADYMVANLGYSPQYIDSQAKEAKYIAHIGKRVYDMTEYITGGRWLQWPPGYKIPKEKPNRDFMDERVVELFRQHSGQDITNDWNALPLDAALRERMQLCLDNLFYVANLDTRGDIRCVFAKWILLAVSILLVSVIAFKFFAALQFGRKNIPEKLDKFIIATVPAYTEDEESLRRAIDSAARLRYDDKRKLLFIVCDGMIVGQGNDRPTPRIVLDILGVPETADPEPLSFESLGEGQKQHNMAKVYTGLYEVQGHIVPFVVVVKVGKPSEVSRPGNRGKRDSQMILMRFLNRVHYNLPMTPLELELHHQIRNVIGVNPAFYEFLLQIDADTVVARDAATRFVSAFLSDTRVLAVCGETALSNAKSSFITMMQVYEYYISHNLTKAFESLFGSVTCLPGCFSMYRIRASDSGKPLFVSREVVEEYSEIRVDTLHSKNLLHLGEDRYLTTLLLKHHPKYKTKYIMRAHAWTIAPDSWEVFMSQRRRWINSTVHNLIELIPLQQLCGFCCFSMRFVVFVDLLSTVVQPVIVFYIIYLVFLCVTHTETLPVAAIVLLGAIYGLQAIIFILRRKWEMIGWMVIYILALPVFSLGLPLYSFWHMDDFSWGNTRIVMGEKGQQIIVSDEGKFDPSTIPRRKWEDYQAELWEAQTTQDDARSEVSGVSYATHSWHPAMSERGGGGRYSRSLAGLSTAAPVYPHAHSNGSRGSLGTDSDPILPYVAGTTSTIELGPVAGGVNYPSDDALLAEIREILRTADLMVVTKKTIKAELERRFGVPLDEKKPYIGSATEAILSGQL